MLLQDLYIENTSGTVLTDIDEDQLIYAQCRSPSNAPEGVMLFLYKDSDLINCISVERTVGKRGTAVCRSNFVCDILLIYTVCLKPTNVN